jgi:hypothetical protein
LTGLKPDALDRLKAVYGRVDSPGEVLVIVREEDIAAARRPSASPGVLDRVRCAGLPVLVGDALADVALPQFVGCCVAYEPVYAQVRPVRFVHTRLPCDGTSGIASLHREISPLMSSRPPTFLRSSAHAPAPQPKSRMRPRRAPTNWSRDRFGCSP